MNNYKKYLRKYVLYDKIVEEKNNKLEEMLSNITIDDIDEETLKKLSKKGIIKRVGSDKNGYRQILNKE